MKKLTEVENEIRIKVKEIEDIRRRLWDPSYHQRQREMIADLERDILVLENEKFNLASIERQEEDDELDYEKFDDD